MLKRDQVHGETEGHAFMGNAVAANKRQAFPQGEGKAFPAIDWT